MHVTRHEQVGLTRRGVSRRSFLHAVSAGAVAAGTLSFRDLLSLQAAELRKQGRSMILLWMAGGPSQFETFDPKPDHENGGQTEAIATSVPGIRIANGWEKTAQVMDDIALIRSMTNKEGNHQRATYQIHTGYVPSGSVKHPSFASSIAKQISSEDLDLPAFVSVGQTEGAGFLGVEYEPFVVQSPGEMPRNVAATVTNDRVKQRLGLFSKLEGEFAERGGRDIVESQRQLYNKTANLVLSEQTKAFDISEEPDELKAAYGDTEFGRGCLLARRLVETGVSFVEVRKQGWDTHEDLYDRVSNLSAEVDPAYATLITDLKQRGLLEKTVVVWMGEFGRTPKITPRGGRNHYPRAFNLALAGGGIKGGQIIGSTTDDGSAVEDRPVSVPDLLCSLCHSLDVNPRHEHISPLGRPMKIVDGGEVVSELFA
ncbi:MAG: DUF1501 domain-containing protein [Planctomycetaceae bacterium]|nr:DUF1501 domain-containing protein [Planctomycetaceae bacterium]